MKQILKLFLLVVSGVCSFFIAGCVVPSVDVLPHEIFPTEIGPSKNFELKAYTLNEPLECATGQLLMSRREFDYYSGNDAVRPTKNCSIVLAPTHLFRETLNFVNTLRTIDRPRILGITKYKDRKCYIVDVGGVNAWGGDEARRFYRGLLVDAETFQAVDRFVIGPGVHGYKGKWVSSTWKIWLGDEIQGKQVDVSPKDTKFIPSTRVLKYAQQLMVNYDLVYGGMSDGSIMLAYREYTDYRFAWVTEAPGDKVTPLISRRRLIVNPDHPLYKKQLFFKISNPDQVIVIKDIQIKIHAADKDSIRFTIISDGDEP